MSAIRGWAVAEKAGKLFLHEYQAGPLAVDEVEVQVLHCGVCHSDLSMVNNDWGGAAYPFIPGHEIVGKVVALGAGAKALKIGQHVGIGWTAASCMHCRSCLAGEQHLCKDAVATMIGQQGGFAERVRAHWAFALPLPEELPLASAGPLMCGGITVFSPLYHLGVKPTHRVGVVGIGGLGHLALKFAAAWGTDVTAFTSHVEKAVDAKRFGAQRVISSGDSEAIRAAAGSIDFLLIAANATFDWQAFISTLAPNGRMHVVGAVPAPIAVKAFDLIGGQHCLSGSPTGSPATIARMLEFAARHKIAPEVEHFPMSRVNDALAHLAAGKARYRIVLDADFS